MRIQRRPVMRIRHLSRGGLQYEKGGDFTAVCSSRYRRGRMSSSTIASSNLVNSQVRVKEMDQHSGTSLGLLKLAL